MYSVGWLLLAVLIASCCTAAAPLLRDQLRGRVGAVFGGCIVPIILVWPSVVPPANVRLRAASAFASGDITFKMVESFRHWGHGERSLVLRDSYRRLTRFPVLAAVDRDRGDHMMPNVSLVGLTPHVADLERSLSFYTRIPGATVEVHRPGLLAILRIGKGGLASCSGPPAGSTWSSR